MVAFTEHQHVFAVLLCVRLSCTDIVFMMLVFSRNTVIDPFNFRKQTASVMGHLSQETKGDERCFLLLYPSPFTEFLRVRLDDAQKSGVSMRTIWL